ncbi:MAG: hypothetical protein Q8873_04345 [Bacillota bacterium]|nr:hypothetical protein [Bacillota bacterium]
MSIAAININWLKNRGFLQNRTENYFTAHIVAPCGVFTCEQIETISECAKKYGKGIVSFNGRLAAEIAGIHLDKIHEVEEIITKCGLQCGGTGDVIRPVTISESNPSKFENYDIIGLGKILYDVYFKGWKDILLPHTFDIGLGDYPDKLINPTFNDFTIEGHQQQTIDKSNNSLQFNPSVNNPVHPHSTEKFVEEYNDFVVYQIYLGGQWKGKIRMPNPLFNPILQGEIIPLIEKCLLWFRENAYIGEPFGCAIDRLGKNKFEYELFDENLIKRKNEILCADLKKHPMQHSYSPYSSNIQIDKRQTPLV